MDIIKTSESKFKLIIPNFKCVKSSLNSPCESVPDYIELYFNTFNEAETHINSLKEGIKQKCLIMEV